MFQRQMCLAICPAVMLFMFAGAVRADEPAEAEAKIRKALEGPTQFEFIETPLRDIVTFLQKQHGIPIRLDTKALDDVGVGTDTPLTCNLKGISLRSALNLLLEELNLTYTIMDEILLITTLEVVESQLKVKVYPVRDLTTLPSKKEETPDFDSLSKLIQATQAAHTWQNVGGSGSVSYHSDSLVISQNPPVQDQIALLLASLRELPPLGDPKCGQVKTPKSIPKQDLASQKLLKSLEAKSEGEFIETPLRDVVEFLKDAHDIEIQFARSDLDDAGIGTDSSITKNYKGISLRSALHQILHSLKLNFVLRDEVLVITTNQAYESHLGTVLYPVFDLLDLPATAHTWEVDQALRELIEVITTSVDSNSWDEVGGPGNVIAFVNRAALVISQTGTGHDKVASLLANLRKVRSQQGPSEAARKSTDYTTVVFLITHRHIQIGKDQYDIQVVSPADLESVIRKSVAVDSWNDKRALLKAVPGRLIVRQKRAVLLEIQRFLIQMGLNPLTSGIPGQNVLNWGIPINGGGFGGGGGGGKVPTGAVSPLPGGGFFRVRD